jgi:hypothetical protein
MEYPTLAQIESKVKEDLDLEEEVFIEPTELTGLVNEAIDDAESEIHTIYEDYFKTSHTRDIESGENEQNLPEDIYAQKIREVSFSDGSNVYEVPPYRGKHSDIPLINGTAPYRYILVNKSDGIKLRLIPTPATSVTDGLTIWYLRNANKLVAQSDECDIPEAFNFIVKKTKGLCLAKENNGVVPQEAAVEIEQERIKLVNTLTNRVPDGNNEVIGDFAIYNEHA